jgi:hypothetical protein
MPSRATAPKLGLKPTTPLKAAGRMIETAYIKFREILESDYFRSIRLQACFSERGKRPLFEKSGAKTFGDAGPWPSAAPTPHGPASTKFFCFSQANCDAIRSKIIRL